jgi:hypothetical protein
MSPAREPTLAFYCREAKLTTRSRMQYYVECAISLCLYQPSQSLVQGRRRACIHFLIGMYPPTYFTGWNGYTKASSAVSSLFSSLSSCVFLSSFASVLCRHSSPYPQDAGQHVAACRAYERTLCCLLLACPYYSNAKRELKRTPSFSPASKAQCHCGNPSWRALVLHL